MNQSFFWYDLETTGVNVREGRIMQFAGQRTDTNLEPVGEPVNVLIKLSEDVLPDPDAVLITGITPQQTIAEGITEAEFLKLFYEEVATPGTIFVGFNTVRFDDEFMRFLNYRNFYDAYEWQWKDNRGKWDLLDLVRMTRALRPEGIEWPMTEDGKPTNRLELLTKKNGLDHEHAHDALNDVLASIAVAKLIRTKQPRLFEYLLNLRGKKDVKKFLENNKTFIYSSGKYANEVEKTAVVELLHMGDDEKGAIVYDLRFDPTEFKDLSPKELVGRWRYSKEPDAPARLPAKSLKYNRCPALSPLGLLSDAGVQERLKVTPELASSNRAKLHAAPELINNIVKARELMDAERTERWNKEVPAAEVALYGGQFFGDADKNLMSAVRAAQPDDFSQIATSFHDGRLSEILPLYKARNYAGSLTDEERADWESYRFHKLMGGGMESRMAKYMHRLGELAETEKASEKPFDSAQDKRYLLEELQLYAESIMPLADTGQ